MDKEKTDDMLYQKTKDQEKDHKEMLEMKFEKQAD